MTSRFLFLMLSFLSLYFPFASHGLDLVEGLNEWVLTSCAAHNRHFNEGLLPRGSSKLIQNNRFFGNLTSNFNPEFPPHSQCISTSNLTYFPGDAMASLLQHFFPSPDGVLLVANQTGDSVGKLDARKMGRFLKLIEDYSPKHINELTFKQSIYDLLLDLKSHPDPKTEKSVSKNIQDFSKNILNFAYMILKSLSYRTLNLF